VKAKPRALSCTHHPPRPLNSLSLSRHTGGRRPLHAPAAGSVLYYQAPPGEPNTTSSSSPPTETALPAATALEPGPAHADSAAAGAAAAGRRSWRTLTAGAVGGLTWALAFAAAAGSGVPHPLLAAPLAAVALTSGSGGETLAGVAHTATAAVLEGWAGCLSALRTVGLTWFGYVVGAYLATAVVEAAGVAGPVHLAAAQWASSLAALPPPTLFARAALGDALLAAGLAAGRAARCAPGHLLAPVPGVLAGAALGGAAHSACFFALPMVFEPTPTAKLMRWLPFLGGLAGAAAVALAGSLLHGAAGRAVSQAVARAVAQGRRAAADPDAG